MKSFEEYYSDGYPDERGNWHEPYTELIKQLLEKYPVERMAGILDDDVKKEYIRLMGEILRLRNVLSAFDDFTEELRRSLDRTPSLLAVLKEASLALLVPFIILGGIYGGLFTPTEAGVVACIYAIIIACFVYKLLDFKGLCQTFLSSTKLTCQTMFIVAIATSYARYLTLKNVPTMLSELIRSMTDKPLVFMLLVVFLLLIVGTFMDVGAAMMVMAPIMHPIAMQYGIKPLQFGVVMTMALIIGLTTPPVGSSLYVMASMTDLPFLDIAKKMVPFTLGYVVVMILLILFPALSTVLVPGA